MKIYKMLKGFTLIELMITIAIVGILAAVAYPSYISTIKKSNRADAKVGLTEVAQQLQRCYTAYGRFDDPDNKNRCSVYEQLTTGASKITTRGSAYYDITFDGNPAVTAVTYRLVATAIKSPQTKDQPSSTVDCKEMKLDQTGLKTPADCW